MASISAADLAQEVLDSCLADGTWPGRALESLIQRALDENDMVAAAASRAMFGILIERLGDLFDPGLCDLYATLFSHVIERAMPEYSAADLYRRYKRIRQIHRFQGGEVRRVFVLSRITLGADVAVTSVLLAAAKERFPDAEIYLVGPEKNAELFAADSRINSLPVAYARSSLLRDRLAAAIELETLIDEPTTIVIDPDSRLTQLGLIPVCDDARYFFFESRAYGGESDSALPDLVALWLSEVFDVGHYGPYAAPEPQTRVADIAVSLGVGENENKRLTDDFEYALLSNLLTYGRPVLLDRGAGGDEAARVNALVQRLGSPLHLLVHDGPYASFASHILQSNLYVGYDSAGQHVASAGGVPLVSVFAGYACERMLSRWSPYGATAHVIAVGPDTDPAAILARTLTAVAKAAEAGLSPMMANSDRH